MTEPTRGAAMSVVSGRHARLPGPAGLRRACQAVLILLAAQLGMGMYVNLYVPVPASDQHASYLQEIKTAPFALTLHVVLGLLLIGGAGILLIRAIGIRDWLLTAMTAAGLIAILGAFGAGELFVRNGQSSASLTMALLTAAALACYVAVLGRASAGFRQAMQAAPYPAGAARPAGFPPAVPLPSRPHPVSGPQPRLDYPQTRSQPNPRYAPWPQAPWPQATGQAPPVRPGAPPRPGAPARGPQAGRDFQNPGRRGPAGPPGSGRWRDDEGR